MSRQAGRILHAKSFTDAQDSYTEIGEMEIPASFSLAHKPSSPTMTKITEMAKKTKVGVCALCAVRTELQESHIASKFLWKESGIIGHARKFSLSSPTHPELDEQHLQDGLKEYLLCQDCEGRFGRYEDYAARVFFRKGGPAGNRPPMHHVLTGLDYTSLKLFQMSILWRMAVSNHPYYSQVELGKHQEQLRAMLLAEDPGEPWQYGCIATLLDHGGKPVKGIFSQPLKTRRFGHHAYVYTLAGMHWVHFVTSHPVEEEINQVVLQRNGRWVLFRGEVLDFGDLKLQVDRLRQASTETSDHPSAKQKGS